MGQPCSRGFVVAAGNKDSLTFEFLGAVVAMRSFSHWTPRYVFNRLRLAYYERTHPDEPWLTPHAVKLLNDLILPADRMLEFGAGRSTLWFARRVGSLTSVESNKDWQEVVFKQLAAHGLRCEVKLRTPEETTGVLDDFEDESLDLCLVDAGNRGELALGVLPKLKPGAILVFDNVNWFLPSESISPKSRSAQDGPLDGDCRRFQDSTKSWRRIWTTSGVTDTLLLFKPCS